MKICKVQTCSCEEFNESLPCDPCPFRSEDGNIFGHCHAHCWEDWHELVKTREPVENSRDWWPYVARTGMWALCDCNPKQTVVDAPALPEDLT